MSIAFQINAFQSIDQSASAVGGIQSAEAFGTAAVGPYVPIVDTSIQSQEAFGVPQINRLGVSRTVSGVGAIVSAQAFGEHRVVLLFPSGSGDLGDVSILVVDSALSRVSPEDHELAAIGVDGTPIYVVRESQR